MSAGDLDTTFAGDGSALVQFPGSSFIVSDVAVAPDGKVVVSGHKGDTPAVARLNADGSIDTTFASLGLFEFDSSIDRRLESATAVAVQPDGRVLVTGHHGDDFAVARFTTSGALDASWGTSGIATTGIHEDADAYDLAIQPDGKVVVVGDTTEDEYWRNNYKTRPYVKPDVAYDDLHPAYKHGWESRTKHVDRKWDEVENDLGREWDKVKGKSRLEWEQAKDATRDAWDRVSGDDRDLRR